MTARRLKDTTREDALVVRFRRQTGLGPMADYLERAFKHPARQKQSVFDVAHDLVEAIENDRTAKARARGARRTGALAHATMQGVAVGPGTGLSAAQRDALGSMGWVSHGTWSVVVGPATPATYRGSAIVNQAMDQGLRPERIKANEWVLEHESGEFRGGVPAACRRLVTTPLLVIDNFARTSANPFHCNMLVQLLEARRQPVSRATLILSPTPMSEWLPMFQCPGSGAAICEMAEQADVFKLRQPKRG